MKSKVGILPLQYLDIKKKRLASLVIGFSVGIILTFLSKQANFEYDLNLDMYKENVLFNTLKSERDPNPKGLLDLKSFTWLLNNKNICANDGSQTGGGMFPSRLMPILIHSARHHFTARLAIRKTWGSLDRYLGWSIRLVFLLGEGKPVLNETLLENEKIHKEQDQFGDLVMGNFIDSYHNLTYKHLMGYKWILNFCPEAEIITKVDDDVFLDIMQWLELHSARLNFKPGGVMASKEPQIFCRLWERGVIFRNNITKWAVPHEYMPGVFYPPFCSGRTYGIKRDLLTKIYIVSHEIKFNWIDDVFVTGQVIQAVNKKYNKRVYFADISDACTYIPKGNYTYCRKNGERKFYMVSVLPHSELLMEDMICMWNITVSEFYKYARNPLRIVAS